MSIKQTYENAMKNAIDRVRLRAASEGKYLSDIIFHMIHWPRDYLKKQTDIRRLKRFKALGAKDKF